MGSYGSGPGQGRVYNPMVSSRSNYPGCCCCGQMATREAAGKPSDTTMARITGHAPYLPSDTLCSQQIAPYLSPQILVVFTYLHSLGLLQKPFSLLQPAAHLAETEEHVRFIYAVIYTTAGWVARPTLLIYGICGGSRGVFSGCDSSVGRGILWL